FSEPVAGFATGDVTLGGTAGATTATVTETAPNDGTTYDIRSEERRVGKDGTASISAGDAHEASNNPNNASTSNNNTNTRTSSADIPSRDVTIERPTAQSDRTRASTIHFTVVFSEPVAGFATGDVTLGGTAGATTATVTETAPNDGTTYDI